MIKVMKINYKVKDRDFLKDFINKNNHNTKKDLMSNIVI